MAHRLEPQVWSRVWPEVLSGQRRPAVLCEHCDPTARMRPELRRHGGPGMSSNHVPTLQPPMDVAANGICRRATVARDVNPDPLLGRRWPAFLEEYVSPGQPVA